MIIEDEYEYRSYRIHCAANTTSSRRFAASLVITRVTPERLTERHFPHVESFATKREALEHARQVGMAWIDAQDQVPTPPPLSTLSASGVRVS